MERNIIIRGSVTAELMTEFFRKVGDGTIVGEHVAALLAHRNPFENEYVDDGLDVEEQLRGCPLMSHGN